MDYTENGEDENSDGYKSNLNVTFDIYEESIDSLDIYLFVNYSFKNAIEIEFNDVIQISSNTKSGNTGQVIGYLDLIQSESYNEM